MRKYQVWFLVALCIPYVVIASINDRREDRRLQNLHQMFGDLKYFTEISEHRKIARETSQDTVLVATVERSAYLLSKAVYKFVTESENEQPISYWTVKLDDENDLEDRNLIFVIGWGDTHPLKIYSCLFKSSESLDGKLHVPQRKELALQYYNYLDSDIRSKTISSGFDEN